MESPRELKASQAVGTKAPLYAGATSKCLLAFSSEKFIKNYMKTVILTPLTDNTITEKNKLVRELEIIKEKGYAASLAETTQGLGALSAPVFTFSSGNSLLAGLSLAIPEVRFNDHIHRSMCIRELLLAAKDFSEITG